MLVAAVVLILLAVVVVVVVINDYVVFDNMLKIGQNGTKQTH